jgi:hypothetical protein
MTNSEIILLTVFFMIVLLIQAWAIKKMYQDEE